MKVINKIGDWLFTITDRYFQGDNFEVPCESSQFPGQISEAKTMSWELNQGVEDIILKDLIISAKFLIPSVIASKIHSVVKRVRFLFLVDAAIEDEAIDTVNITTTSTPISDHKIALTNEWLTYRKKQTISLSEWLKRKLPYLRAIIRCYKRVKPLYLLGDFSPVTYSISSNKTKFLDTYVYHLRN